MSRVTVTVEGGLLPDDLLERIADGSAPGQRAADFGLASGRLSDEIMRAFSDAQSYWTAFKHRHERASKSGRESVTTITRESFVIPLLEALSYKLEFKRSLTAGDQSFVISHTSGDEPTAPPVNIVGADDKLDERGSSRRSAHSSVQEYLNVSDCLWGIATNGNKLRVLRDSSRLAKPRYIEFDFAGMMESNVYSDFHLLYRLLHRTRLPHSSADASECWLEKYYQDGIEQGSRVRDRLRDGVAEALNLFGNAFLAHPQSEYLRKRIAAGELTAAAYYRELLRLVYRLLFLMVAEERRLMFPDSRENEQRRTIFSEHYGVNRLRARAEGYIGDDPEIDLWESLKLAFQILRNDRTAHMLGMAALNGELFGPYGCPHLDGGSEPEQSAFCSNDKLLRAIHSLSTFDDGGVRRRVNFGALDVEELGSVYESLLEYHPQLSPSPVSFDLVWGSERKSTGSYYTPPELVRELINSALVPVMEERSKSRESKEERERAILSMRVIDPSAGSGHFLLAAARQIGRELAKIRTGEAEPTPSAFRSAVRDVIRECIYAVDKNPLAVDLCKVALWIEGHNAGQPLSFLDHHVKSGDSLVGVFDLKVLEEGVPDEAYKAVEGDDRAAAKHYRTLNRETKKNRPTLPQFKLPDKVVATLETLSHRDERTPEDVSAKEREYGELINSSAMQNLESACNAWAAAFFVPLRMPEFRGRDLVPTSSTVWERLSGRQIYGLLDAEIAKARTANSFFHWPVEFPDVFARGGFDVVLGNPPWDHVELKEKEFFEQRRPEVARAANASARKKLIASLASADVTLYEEFRQARHAHDSFARFLGESERFPLCGRGRINTYAVFAELSRELVAGTGRVGIIVPTGIATDDTNKLFFRELVQDRTLVSLYDFQSSRGLFSEVGHARYKFCLLTLSGVEATPQESADFVFFARDVAHLHDEPRRIKISAADIALINPNSLTCPIFRNKREAEITKAAYRAVPVLIQRGSSVENPWAINLKQGFFNISEDAQLFRTRTQLEREGWRLDGNTFRNGTRAYLPMYEGRLGHQFDHRFAIEPGGSLKEVSLAEHQNPNFLVEPHYWVSETDFSKQLSGKRFLCRSALLGFRRVARSTDERTAVACLLPWAPASYGWILSIGPDARALAILAAAFNSFGFDFLLRTALSQPSIPLGTFEQVACPTPEMFSTDQAGWIVRRVLELTYTAFDLGQYACEIGYDGPPFRWDDDRRFLIRCELDAAFLRIYGISQDDAGYILDTFHIVKRKDEERYGEFRTKRLIQEIHDDMERAKKSGGAYQTRLDPPPGDPRAAHQGREPTVATPPENP